jgi:peptidoglycan hydrolase CwlO-like protein
MKKLIIILFCLLSFASFGQISYPRFETDSSGKKLVVLTLEQAQALDNSTDLLILFEKLDSQIGNYDSICIKVIEEKDHVIAVQTVQISKLKEALQGKDDQIANLQKTLQKKEEKITSLEKENKNKDTEIALHKKQIGKLKFKSLLSNTGLLVVAVLTIMIIK